MKIKGLRIQIIAIAFLLFSSSFAFADNKAETEWREKQKSTVQIVHRLIQVGTRFPAYRCGLYVPGTGMCYMKMAGVNMPDTSGKAVPAPFVWDVAETIEVIKMAGAKKVLAPAEKSYLQSRFLNKTYLRIFDRPVTEKIAAVKKKNLLAYNKIISDVVTWVDGKHKEDKADVWISTTTQKFSSGALRVGAIPDEGMIIPDRAIVLYNRFPGLLAKKGEDALADKLYDILKDSKPLIEYYKKYDIAVGVESGNQLLFAKYPIRSLSGLTRENLKYFRYTPDKKESKDK